MAWHFIIPFYYGENKFVLVKGGAPVKRKMAYLTQTVRAIERLGNDHMVTVFVCNEQSKQRALKVCPTVTMLDCPPLHLPLESVRNFQQWFRFNGSDDDVVAFNEDDQILYMADSVMEDIQDVQERVVFSPHRWARQFLYFRRKGRPVFKLNGRRGLLDNVDREQAGARFQFRHAYVAQTTKNAAYAACWMMKGSLFRSLDLSVPAENIELESASYVVFGNRVPVLKLRIDDQQPLSAFMVDHLSGYDYNRRLIK